MTQQAVIVRFPGDPDDLAKRYARGLREFGDSDPKTRPEAIFLGRSEKTPNELVVTILWPQGVDHHVLGAFLFERLAKLGLGRPSIEHLAIDRSGFGSIANLE